MSLAGVISMTRLLNWSLMSVLPLARRTARVGSGAELVPDSVSVRYSQTTVSAALTSTMRLLFASVISVFRCAAGWRTPPVDRACSGKLPHELLACRHFDDAVVVLVGNQDVTFSSSSALFGLLSWLAPPLARASCRTARRSGA